jgi:hypothetical protein
MGTGRGLGHRRGMTGRRVRVRNVVVVVVVVGGGGIAPADTQTKERDMKKP